MPCRNGHLIIDNPLLSSAERAILFPLNVADSSSVKRNRGGEKTKLASCFASFSAFSASDLGELREAAHFVQDREEKIKPAISTRFFRLISKRSIKPPDGCVRRFLGWLEMIYH